MPNAAEFFDQKTIVITGAASGIGEALATVFASYGAKLALADIDYDNLQIVAESISQQHADDRVFSYYLDVSNRDQWQAFLAESAKQFGAIDIVINNAGIEGSSRPVWATDPETLEQVMKVNFYGMVNGSQLALPYLVKRDWAALVNVSSIFGLIGPTNAADYAASKFAIRGYTEALHSELAEVYPQVQVHLVHPGGINTNITRVKQSQSFKRAFLKTPPEALAKKIASSIMENSSRIVFGNQSTLVKIAARLLPMGLLSRLIAKEMRKLDMNEDYRKDHPGFNNKDIKE